MSRLRCLRHAPTLSPLAIAEAVSPRARSYCSDKCAAKARTASRSAKRAEAQANRVCAVCGAALELLRSTRRYCSTACRRASGAINGLAGVRFKRDQWLSSGATLLSTMMPIAFGERSEEPAYMVEDVVLRRPPDVALKPLPLRVVRYVPPGGEDQRQGRVPSRSDGLLVRQHVPELVPRLRHGGTLAPPRRSRSGVGPARTWHGAPALEPYHGSRWRSLSGQLQQKPLTEDEIQGGGAPARRAEPRRTHAAAKAAEGHPRFGEPRAEG
jgi:hypothetical protein